MAFRWPWNRVEQRSTLSGLTYPQEWLAGAFGASPTTTGQRVTVKNALGVSAVWAAVSMIAEQVGQLPLNVYKLVDDDRVEAGRIGRGGCCMTSRTSTRRLIASGRP
jgi:phage portal protein BeeE